MSEIRRYLRKYVEEFWYKHDIFLNLPGVDNLYVEQVSENSAMIFYYESPKLSRFFEFLDVFAFQVDYYKERVTWVSYYLVMSEYDIYLRVDGSYSPGLKLVTFDPTYFAVFKSGEEQMTGKNLDVLYGLSKRSFALECMSNID